MNLRHERPYFHTITYVLGRYNGSIPIYCTVDIEWKDQYTGAYKVSSSPIHFNHPSIIGFEIAFPSMEWYYGKNPKTIVIGGYTYTLGNGTFKYTCEEIKNLPVIKPGIEDESR